MKNQTLLAFGAVLVLALTVGCKSSSPRTTQFPGSSSGTADRANAAPRSPDLSTRPVNTGTPNISGAGAVSGDLPDPDKLRDRTHDRQRFAAQTVYFDFDRASIRPSEASKVDQMVTALKSLSVEHDLLIEGHCDERGTEEYNRALGERRALALRELLMQAGVDGGRIFTKSLGKDQPANPGHDESAWNRNRRGEFILVLPRQITTTQTKQ